MADEKHLDIFQENLIEIPINMRMFSLLLRSFYAENALASSSPTERKMKKLLEDTRRDAIVYVKAALPLSVKVVRYVDEYFENYSALSLEDWKENLSDILSEVKGYKQCCSEVIYMHEVMMKPLKRREDEAKVLVSELKNLKEEYERRQKEFEASAYNKRCWAIGLSFIPVINLIVTPLLGISADSDMAEAVAKRQECRIQEATVMAVRYTMIPAISAFINGLNAAVGLFSIVENQIEIFLSNRQGSMRMEKRHYTMMKSRARKIQSNCQAFYAVLPGVRTDLRCIPEKPSDKNYVEKWLANQKEEIRRRYGSSITDGLRNLMEHFSTKDCEKLLIKEN